jgi:alpha-D-ribose 1-methylphosphonate 5-triphosphate synthase subunit PhnH
VRALGIDPVHGTRETFDALVDAMSHPGTVRTAPEPADHAVLATLVDHEVTVATDDDELRESLAAEGRLAAAATGAAAFVHVAGDAAGAADAVRDAPRGALTEPSNGATVVCRVDGLDADVAPDDPVADRRAVDYQSLRLAGPGVPGERTLGVAGLTGDVVDAVVEAGSAFPRGVDVVLTTERRVAALPRSIDLEVV